MQNEIETVETIAETQAAAIVEASVSAPAEANTQAAAKRVRAKRAKQSKPAAKPATVAAKPAKPTQAAREAAQRDRADSNALARTVCHAAMREFYSGASLPFKAAHVKLSPLNGGSRVCGASKRSAALLVCLATYGKSAFRADASFVRAGFRVPASLFDKHAPADALISAKPEAGCIGDQRDRTISFDSDAGDRADAILRLNVAASYRDVQAAFGDKLARAFVDTLAGYGVKPAVAFKANGYATKPAKPAKAA